MKISIIKNAKFEDPGTISEWVELRGHELTIYEAYLNELPELGTFDFLIILGSPNSVNDDLPWISEEKRMVKCAIEKGTFVFGICFGAQLIASILGAEIYPSEHKEIGWHPIKCAHNFLQQEITVFHWHGETFSLPKGSDLLASSVVCETQAFAFSDSVLGLQFHLEMNENTIDSLISNCSVELRPGKYIQDVEKLKNRSEYLANCREELFDLLDGFQIRFES